MHFPEIRNLYSNSAEDIMSRDLEISEETDAETLREWVENIRGNPKLLEPLIEEYGPKKK